MSTLFPVTIGSVTIFGTEIAGCTRHTRLVTERAAVMSLINQVFGPAAMLSHTPYGAPFIADNPTRISISHGAGLAILATSPDTPIGIDVECWRDQLLHVTHKFLTPDEQTAFATDHILLLKAWTAKEAVYKAASTPGLSLTDIHLDLSTTPAQASISGTDRTYTLHHIDRFPVIITLALQKIG